MTYFRVLSIIAAILIMVGLLPGALFAQRQWNLEIELAKDHYVLHEPIWLDIRLTNIGADTQRTDGLVFPNHRHFTIEVKDKLGNPRKYNWIHYDRGASPGHLLLRPKEQDFGSFDLVTLFRSRERNSGYAVIDKFPLIPRGAYTVQVYFEDAVSNELTFTVAEPAGEAKEVLELIEQVSSVWNLNNTDPSARIFREAVERFPNSVLAERCYYLSEAYSMEAREKLKNGSLGLRPVYRKMLEHYPNSGDVGDWIATLTSGMDKRAKRNFLDSLAQAHPNTRSAKYARVKLEQMKREKADK